MMKTQRVVKNTLQEPLHSLRKMLTGGVIAQAIFVAARLGIADLLKDGALSSDELARLSGANSTALYRVLRTLASEGIFAENRDKHFELTPLAECLQSGVQDSIRDIVIMSSEPWFWASCGDMLHSVTTGQSAFRHIHGMDLFEYFTNNTETAGIFNDAMVQSSKPLITKILAAYDFSGINRIVDVGGGCGILLAAILKAHPHLQGVLFEQPDLFEEAKKTLDQEGVTARCELVAGNFFESVPIVGDTYILKKVIHDWGDEDALKILKSIHRYMPQHGKLLLVEYIIPPDNAPSPSHVSDLLMMVITGGLERSESQFRVLLERAGLKLTNIIAVSSSNNMNLIEAVRA